MEPSQTPPTPATPRRDPDSGRVAVPEIAELLHLQRPAAAVAAAAVVLLGLLLTLVAPGILPANVVTGVIVGLLALLAGVATAVLLDGRDPVLRGPRHLRRDGHTVLARMAGPDPVQHGGPVLAALERRLEGREHLGVVLTGDGCNPSELAVTLGRAAAAVGHTALVIDLRAPGAPGIADVGEGTVRLGEAARLAEDRPYAWIGAGLDRDAAASATAGVARRPPRDLSLLLVVAPEAATHMPDVLRACDRTVLLVAADTQQRAMVTARIRALERAGARAEAVVVGGVHALADDAAAIADDRAVDDGTVMADDRAVADDAPGAPGEEPEPTVPSSPAPPPTVPEPPDPDEPEPRAEATPAEDAEDEADAADVEDVEDVEDEGPPAAHQRDPLHDTGPLPPVFRTAAPSRPRRDPGLADTPRIGNTEVEGMAEPDQLLTLAALDQLVSDRPGERDAG